MTTSVRTYFYGGLKNLSGATHVIVAVQALLHSAPFVDFLLQYEEHRKKCRSLLSCISCALFRVHDSISRTGIADPSSLILRWNGISSRMVESKKTDPFQVLSVLIDVMRSEYVYSSSECSSEAMHSFGTSKIFEVVSRIEVHCPSCGKFQQVQYNSSVELEVVADLQFSINRVFEKRDADCTQCKRNALTSCLYVSIPECLIVYVKQSTPQFSLPFQLNVQGSEFLVRSLIAEKAGTIQFISRCPDGSFKQFEDTKISPVNFASVSNAEHLHKSKMTLLYEKKIKKLQPQIVSSPDESSTEPAADDNPRTRTIGTQTVDTPPNVVDAAVQTEPYFCYEVCKLNPKFRLFTGLVPEDFEVLYSLIGGHESIRCLKLKYRDGTPKKLRPTKLSSKDKLFMFLLRLRRGLPLEEIAEMFNCSVSSAGELCYVMTRLIYLTLKKMEDAMFPSTQQQRKHKPKQMRPFKNLRIILDGASYIQTPTNFEQQGNCYSSYKSHTVHVFSVGISCNGATIFCSDGMEGSASDKEVILRSNLLSRLCKGDGVMTEGTSSLLSSKR